MDNFSFDYWLSRYTHPRQGAFEYLKELYWDYRCVAHKLGADATSEQKSLLTYKQFVAEFEDMARESSRFQLLEKRGLAFDGPRLVVSGIQLYHREYTDRERSVVGSVEIDLDTYDFSSPEA